MSRTSSKRKVNDAGRVPSSSKRQRGESGTLFTIGAPSADDSAVARLQLDIPTSSASSSRTPPCLHVPRLTSLCGRVFASNFVKLRNNEQHWAEISSQLKLLPDHSAQMLFMLLSAACPTYIPHEIIVTVGASHLCLLIVLTHHAVLPPWDLHYPDQRPSRCKTTHNHRYFAFWCWCQST